MYVSNTDSWIAMEPTKDCWQEQNRNVRNNKGLLLLKCCEKEQYLIKCSCIKNEVSAEPLIMMLAVLMYYIFLYDLNIHAFYKCHSCFP